MKLSEFNPFETKSFPENRIAQTPARFRDNCRLMVVHAKSGVIEHRESFRDILDFFDEKDVFVFNDSKVFPARLYGNKEKTGARIEVFLLRELNEEMHLWDVLVDPARKIRIGNKLYFGENSELVAEVIDNTTSRGRTLRFLYDGPSNEFRRILFSLGEAPLPKEMITREATPQDLRDFQCIFARNVGAVTAPSSGLHFSPQMMKMMEIKGIESAFVTLHCGLSCFRDIDVEDLSKHKMESEEMFVNADACRIVNAAHDRGSKIVAIGTTVQRALETAVSADAHLKEYEGWTNKFIFPPYKFTLADAMVANFYMPYSTLLMVVCAFAGHPIIMRAYREAMRFNENDPEKRYRFGVYGDAMLIIND